MRDSRPNGKDMPRDFGPQQLKLKRGDVRVRTRGGLTAVWKDRREVYMPTSTHHQQKEIFVTTATTQ
jgi:hypothetical protein